jgi:hypothetical protein
MKMATRVFKITIEENEKGGYEPITAELIRAKLYYMLVYSSFYPENRLATTVEVEEVSSIEDFNKHIRRKVS